MTIAKTKAPAKKTAEPQANPNIPLGLGVTARDRVTGLIGIVSHKNEMLTGNVQYGIQPKGNGESVPDAFAIDHHLLEVLDEGISKILPPADDTVTIKIGNEVQDTVTGLRGLAIEKVTFQNGCVYFYVQAPMGNKDTTVPDTRFFSHRRLKFLKKGMAKDEAPEAIQPAKKTPGGPTRRAPSLRG